MLDIGPKSEKSCDSFSIRVATPAGLTMLEAKNGVLATRPLLIMQRYDFNDLWSWLESTVEKCEGESWQDCIDNLRRYFDWEYQEYKEV